MCGLDWTSGVGFHVCYNISRNMLFKINSWISDDQYATNISTFVSPDVVAFEL